jgi:hypothetical protein
MLDRNNDPFRGSFAGSGKARSGGSRGLQASESSRLNGRAFRPGNLPPSPRRASEIASILYQGTTSVVPQTGPKRTRALAPEEMLDRNNDPFRGSFASSGKVRSGGSRGLQASESSRLNGRAFRPETLPTTARRDSALGRILEAAEPTADWSKNRNFSRRHRRSSVPIHMLAPNPSWMSALGCFHPLRVSAAPVGVFPN